MIINQKVVEGVTWYTFSKGRFSYSVSRNNNQKFGHWVIETTDKAKVRPHNWTSKIVFEHEMKAKIWIEFLALMNDNAISDL